MTPTMAANLTHALALAARGFRVFPLIPGGKTPAFAGWKDAATFDEPTVRTWFEGEYRDSNVGVATGKGLLAVDADVKNGKPGLRSLELIDMMGAELGFVVATPSGGRHAYFRVTDGAPVPNSVDSMTEFPGVDIRGDGGYVVAPGTPGYDILADRATPEVPTWLLEAARGTKRIRERNDGNPLIELDTEPNIQRAIAYLRDSAPEAVEGSGGNDTTFRVLARVKDFGVSEHIAVDLLLAHWNEDKASPPWQPEEIERIAANVYAYGTGAPGKASALAEFEPVELEVTDSDPNLGFARPVTYGDAAPPPREWAVDKLIPRYKTTLLTGDGGVGKSLLGQQLLTAVAADNQTFFGLPTEHGPVIAVFSEDDEAELWRRQIDINRAMGIDMDALGGVNWWSADHVAAKGCVLMSFTRENPEGKLGTFYRRLESAIKAVRPALVLLDPVANMFGGSEIDRSQVTLFINRTVNRLCVEYRTTAVVLAHPSVAGMAEGSGRSGSTGWSNAVRSRLYLSRPENDPSGDYRALTTTKANYGKFGDQLMLKWSQGAFVLATGGGPDNEARMALFAAVKAMLGEGLMLSPSPHSPSYVVSLAMRREEAQGLKRTPLAEALDELIALGALRVTTGVDPKHPEREKLVLGDGPRTLDDMM